MAGGCQIFVDKTDLKARKYNFGVLALYIWIKGRGYNIQNILPHTYRVIILQTGKSVMSNLVQMSDVCAH